jgi:hypothetical protein
LASTTNTTASVQFGQQDDIPVPSDYDGDAKTDVAVFKPSAGSWMIVDSSTSTLRTVQLGLGSDIRCLPITTVIRKATLRFSSPGITGGMSG